MADEFLVRQQQIAAAVEASPGTAETLTASDVGLKPWESPSFSNESNRFTNEELNDDLAQSPDYVSGNKGALSFNFQVYGSGAVATEPTLARYLRGCGMKQQTVKTITIGAVSGGDNAFAEGEAYTATGGKAGVIDKDTTTGTLQFIATAGGDLADTDVVSTADGDSATCSGAASDYGFLFTPDSGSSGGTTLTIERREGSTNSDVARRHQIRGAMGSFRLECPVHAIPIFRSDWMGVKSNYADIASGGLFSPVTIAKPALNLIGKFINSTFQLNGVDLKPSQFTFDMASTVDLDPDGTAATGGGEGYDRARVLSRDPSLTVDPRALPQSDLDIQDLLESAALVPFHFIAGASGGITAGHIVEIQLPAVQVQAAGEGERSDRRTTDLTLAVKRTTQETPDRDVKIYFR